MKFFLVVLLLFMASSSWAQLKTEKSVTEELNVTSADEAKPFLIFKATNEAITQFSPELGFNLEEFRTKLEKKFTVYFENYKERQLVSRFGKNYALELAEDQKKDFLNGLDSHRPEVFMKFSRFAELLDEHNFKQIENDPKNPKLWKGTVNINVNRVRLDALVKRILSDEEKKYSRLNIITEINLMGFNWIDLGLEQGTSFTDPLLSSWVKWFEANPPADVGEVRSCREGCLNEFAKWQELPQDENLHISGSELNSLWLKISFNLRKQPSNQNLQEWKFEWDGKVVLLDANTKRVLSTHELLPETKTWRGLEQKALNSALASQMYRSPLGALNSISKKTGDMPQLNRLSRLVIQGHKNMGDVLSLTELIKKEGEGIHLRLQLDVFNQKGAEILCFYQGEEKSFSDLLSRLKELKSTHNYRLVNEFTGVHHLLKMVAE